MLKNMTCTIDLMVIKVIFNTSSSMPVYRTNHEQSVYGKYTMKYTVTISAS